MSVICQNFVQNTWKKDLCSNCFKSIGDHEQIENGNHEPLSLIEETNLNGNCVSQENSFNSLQSTPHTTWKTLISEKNNKNSKPFKLENGFQGRLLTINKAANGYEKQTLDGHVKSVIKNLPEKITNGFESSGEHLEKSVNFSKHHQNNFHCRTTQNYKQENDCQISETNSLYNGVAKRRNEIENKCKKESPRDSKIVNGNHEKFAAKKTNTRLTKSKSEDAILHSILKKSITVPENENNQSRRGSNVGFKDEAPLVIGYGGRDFNPEDLEWDAGSSDEAENASDSLDESEDDKAFSKMTKENTEFNSDTANLITGAVNENQCNEPIKHVNKQSIKPVVNTNKLPVAKGSTDSPVEGSRDGDHPNHVAARSKKVVLTENTDASANVNGYEETKNSTSILEEAPLLREEVVRRVPPSDEVEFSEIPCSQQHQREWSDGCASTGPILQAVNTSLTNRHKMLDDVKMESERQTAVEENAAGVSSSAKSDDATIDGSHVTQAEEGKAESSLNIEPRPSFLHGTASDGKTTAPSAIYGPASDLFVTRSPSSSSSSSEDLGKSQLSLVVNVNESDSNDQESPTEDKPEESRPEPAPAVVKSKPKIPAKPSPTLAKYSKPKLHNGKDEFENPPSEDVYYSVANDDDDDDDSSITLIDHYAESNIYQEANKGSKPETKTSNGRESKLAALAIELEQARNGNGMANTKRQAPAPPKVPDPPLEDPPSCTGRSTPSPPLTTRIDFRGEPIGFSSASSTASSSSQDTETGYASWNPHEDHHHHHKHSKSKTSFLISQYSKCKMIAMGYAEEGARAKKKFSLKKLLKLGKETENSMTFDPNSPNNPKAWKYSENFDRPRAKLEIIHPMDLENKTVTINPGFDSMSSGSVSSFSRLEGSSIRNSVSSDYGSYYSDVLSPAPDTKSEANYEYIHPQPPAQHKRETLEGTNSTSGSASPTPSRCSSMSQASTLTSGSSKACGAPPVRPPKPPPPPRAHSLLPGNKIPRNLDGTFKFPVTSENTNSVNATASPQKPQAPKRQGRTSTTRMGCASLDGKRESTPEPLPNDEHECDMPQTVLEPDECQYQDVMIRETVDTCNNLQISSQFDSMLSSLEKSVEDITALEPQLIDEVHITEDTQKQADFDSEANTTGTKCNQVKTEKVSVSISTRNKRLPITKSPSRQPPIYTKPQPGNITRNSVPWKTLEDSYIALSTSNREILIKLQNQALKKRQCTLEKMLQTQIHWADFEIDATQLSSVFAFGEKIAYHATVPKYQNYPVTLVVTIQQQHCRLNVTNELKYPVLGQFTDYVPSDLMDSSSNLELVESIQATVLVLERCEVTTIECYMENLPESLSEDSEKELCFITLQLIQSLKTLQAQGIESVEATFQNLILAKTKQDRYQTLVLLSDGCYDEIDYSSDCKLSLCQYALSVLFQMLKVQSKEEFAMLPNTKFSIAIARKVFEAAICILSEEKAVSLSQTKTLIECYFWDVIKLLESSEEDIDGMLHRWFDVERSNCIKAIVSDESSCTSIQNELYIQFLIRTCVRNVKEIASCL